MRERKVLEFVRRSPDVSGDDRTTSVGKNGDERKGGEDVFVTTVVGGRDRPELPVGRTIELPGRGTTFVRDLPGPSGAPTIMLLHGWSATADLNWHHCFDALSDRFRVVAIDHRSHGRGLRHDEPFRLADCADDVAAVAAELDIDRLIAVGYSMGGPIAQLLWKRHPHLVSGLVLCSTGAAFAATRKLRMLFRLAAGFSMSRASASVTHAAGSALEVFVRANVVRGATPWGVEQLALHDWRQVLEAAHQIGTYDADSWIGSVSVPTAVVATVDDDVVPSRRQLALARAIPGATLRRLRGGHHACVTHPEAFVPALIDACREVAHRAAARAPYEVVELAS